MLLKGVYVRFSVDHWCAVCVCVFQYYYELSTSATRKVIHACICIMPGSKNTKIWNLESCFFYLVMTDLQQKAQY